VNLADFVFESAERWGGRPAITDLRTGDSLSYGELAREVDSVAAFLRRQGVEPRQRIGLTAPNATAYVPAAFGILAAGACLTPLPLGLAPAETERILHDIDVNGCLTWPGGSSRAADGAVLAAGAAAGFTFHWTDREAAAPGGFPELDPAFVRFTSGTTAESKGVILSHRATAVRAAAASAVLGLTAEDRVLWVLPLAYHFAVTLTAYIRAGLEVLLGPDGSPARLVEELRSRRATVLYASPLHFERMVGVPAQRGPLPSLRLAISTTAPLAAEAAERFQESFGVAVGQAYGIIEAGLPCINRGGEGLPATSVGPPVPGYQVSVLDESGAALPAGVEGEVGVAGPGLFSGYYSPWLPLDTVLRQGYFLTGDIGCFDAGGALHLKGRKKACLSVAGMKFFPEEVEACLNAFPGIRESRVLGRSHHRLGQVPVAEVVLAEPAAGLDRQALEAHCARQLSPLKIPIELAVVEAIPKTAGGKILRRGS